MRKGSKKGPKTNAVLKSKIWLFRAEGGLWTPLKKHEILGHPKNGGKAALGRPKVPKDAQNEAF